MANLHPLFIFIDSESVKKITQKAKKCRFNLWFGDLIYSPILKFLLLYFYWFNQMAVFIGPEHFPSLLRCKVFSFQLLNLSYSSFTAEVQKLDEVSASQWSLTQDQIEQRIRSHFDWKGIWLSAAACERPSQGPKTKYVLCTWLMWNSCLCFGLVSQTLNESVHLWWHVVKIPLGQLDTTCLSWIQRIITLDH